MNMIPFKVLLSFLGIASLIAGIVIYICIRPELPWLLLWMGENKSCDIRAFGYMKSMPSGLHAFGFTCLLGVLLGVSRKALIISGGFWFLVNVMWEIACLPASPWIKLKSIVDAYLLESNLIYLKCTFDMQDILFAGIGAILPVGLYILFMSSKQRFMVRRKGEI